MVKKLPTVEILERTLPDHLALGDVQGGDTLIVNDEVPSPPKLERRRSLAAKPRSWMQKVRSSPERSPRPEVPRKDSPVQVRDPSREPKNEPEKLVGKSDSFAAFARKSWISHSRSPSPSRKKGLLSMDKSGETTKVPAMPSKFLNQGQAADVKSSARAASPKAPMLRRTSTMLKLRPTSVLISNPVSDNSSASSVQRSSMDDRSTPRTSTDKPPMLEPAARKDKSSLGVGMSRRRDDLWSAFRTLENDFSKFQSKSWSLKMNIVRSALLPFLRDHQKPLPSNLRPEDLDRRATILNKWWIGLLEALDGRQNQVISGIDRPFLLEGITMLMSRPEWRAPPSQFAPLCDQTSPQRLGRPRSASSLNSVSSGFLLESVHHNIRNMFSQNLLTQMAIVVGKMSLRHAPASLVTFCGKATAYAFFFVPGVADALVRIWKIKSDDLRRASDELGISRLPNKISMDEVIATFPVHLHALGWSSVKGMARSLQATPTLPLLAPKIPWYGSWVGRWCGRDSDLFFIFVKHYHILAEQFMPTNLPLSSKARAPGKAISSSSTDSWADADSTGFVLVHAQILTALDATIHRQPAVEAPPVTFDDVLTAADASVATLPTPSNNSTRMVAENRLIMLLRDVMSERSMASRDARSTLISAFSKMLQAMTKRTSLYDHNACFVLCDFLEEALGLLLRFDDAYDTKFTDWQFWISVFQRMLESQNSMTDIRLFSFLHTTWTSFTRSEERKEALCVNWLLAPKLFDAFFCHWCPMVRAYFMRVICWRVCREGGETTSLDTYVLFVRFKTLLTFRAVACLPWYHLASGLLGLTIIIFVLLQARRINYLRLQRPVFLRLGVVSSSSGMTTWLRPTSL